VIPAGSRPGASLPLLATQIRVIQIVVGALIAGVLAFATVVIVTGALQKAPQGHFLSYISVGFGTLMAILHVLVPAFVERAGLANQPVGADPSMLCGVFFTRTIIAAALLEGAAMLSIAALLTEHHPWVLGVTAVMLVLLLMQFPSRTRVEHWLEMRAMEREQGS